MKEKFEEFMEGEKALKNCGGCGYCEPYFPEDGPQGCGYCVRHAPRPTVIEGRELRIDGGEPGAVVWPVTSRKDSCKWGTLVLRQLDGLWPSV